MDQPAAGGAPATMSKAEFAKRRGVHPSALSHWLREGKLSARALHGTGRQARIIVEVAERELAESLDPGQQLARGGAAPPASGAPAPAPAPAVPRQGDLVETAGQTETAGQRETAGEVDAPAASERSRDPQHRYRLAKAEQAEHETELARRKLAETDGRYIERGVARALWARLLSELWLALEAWLPDLASDLAAEFGVDRTAMLAILRRALRDFRTRHAGEARESAEALPKRVAESEA